MFFFFIFQRHLDQWMPDAVNNLYPMTCEIWVNVAYPSHSWKTPLLSLWEWVQYGEEGHYWWCGGVVNICCGSPGIHWLRWPADMIVRAAEVLPSGELGSGCGIALLLIVPILSLRFIFSLPWWLSILLLLTIHSLSQFSPSLLVSLSVDVIPFVSFMLWSLSD